MKRYKKRIIIYSVQTIVLALMCIGSVFLFSSGGGEAIIACGLFGIMCYHSAKRLTPVQIQADKEDEEYKDKRYNELVQDVTDTSAEVPKRSTGPFL